MRQTCYICPVVDSQHDLSHLQPRWSREQSFHDARAEQLEPEAMPAVDPVHYDEAVLNAARIVEGTRVLDLGCGRGDLTLALLARGALVPNGSSRLAFGLARAPLLGRPHCRPTLRQVYN